MHIEIAADAFSKVSRLVRLSGWYNSIGYISKVDIRAEQRIVESRIGSVNLLTGLDSYDIFRDVDVVYPFYVDENIAEIIEKADKIREEITSSSFYRCSIVRTIERSFTKSLNYRNVDRTFDNPFIKRRIAHEALFDRLYEMWREVLSDCEDLLKRREELRALRKMKTERVSEMIRAAWKNRNSNVGRSNTGSVVDPMLLSIPTPPTSVAAISSLESGGAVIAIS